MVDEKAFGKAPAASAENTVLIVVIPVALEFNEKVNRNMFKYLKAVWPKIFNFQTILDVGNVKIGNL